MKTIHKYHIAISDGQAIEVPLGAKVIHVGLDPEDRSSIWCEVDFGQQEKEQLTLYVVGTGQLIPPEATRHLGSFTWKLTGTVWHVFTHDEKKDTHSDSHKIGA